MSILERAASLREWGAQCAALAVASALGFGIINALIQYVVPPEVLFQSLLPRAPIIAFAMAIAASVLRSLSIDRGSAAGALTCITTYIWSQWGQPSIWDLPLEQIADRLAIFVGGVIATASVVVFCYNWCLDALRSRSEGRFSPLSATRNFEHTLAVLVVALLVPATQAVSHEGDDAAFGQGAADSRPVPVFDIGGRAAGLKVEPVVRGKVERTVSAFGAVQAADNRKVEVRPTGDVVKLLVREGDTVTRGTPLALIRSADISTVLSALLRDREAIERDIERAKTEIGGSISTQAILVAGSKVEYERERALKLKGISTDVVFLAAKTKYDEQKSRLAVLERQLSDAIKRLNASLQLVTKTAKSKVMVMGLSEKDFAHAVETGEASAEVLFLSPASGLVATISGDTVDVQKRTFLIIDPSQVWVVLDVPESDLTSVRVGQPVSLNIADRALKGAISSMGATVDPTSRTLQARVVIDNAVHKLVPGAPVTAEIVVEQTAAQTLVIPFSALIEEAGTATVYVKQGDNLFRAVAVSTGLRNAELVEITSGLNESDEIVVAGARQLHAQKQLRGGGGQRAHGQGHDHEAGRGHDHGAGQGHDHGAGHGHDHGTGQGHDHGAGHGHDHGAGHGGPGLSWKALAVLALGLLGAASLALHAVRSRKD